MKLLLEAIARDDLRAISDQGEQLFGKLQSIRYSQELLNVISKLAVNPLIYRERYEFTPPIRVCPHKAHVILYRIQDDTVIILRVRHGREDWQQT